MSDTVHTFPFTLYFEVSNLKVPYKVLILPINSRISSQKSHNTPYTLVPRAREFYELKTVQNTSKQLKSLITKHPCLRVTHFELLKTVAHTLYF